MKILHTADWHIGQFKGPVVDGVNLRSQDTVKCLEYMVDVAIKERPDIVCISGDIFHQEQIGPVRYSDEMIHATNIITSLAHFAGYVIVMRGTPNHDGSGQFRVLKRMLLNVNNVCVVTEPFVIKTKYADIACIPGFDKQEFRAKFPGLSADEENLAWTKYISDMVFALRAECEKTPILMAHYTVPGCNMESGQTSFFTNFEPVIPREALIAARYEAVLLGHIHRPQIIEGFDNVFYSGAINAMNFNDEGQDRGFWIHEFNEKGTLVKGHRYTTPYRQFRTITWDPDEVGDYIREGAMYLHRTGISEDVTDKIVRVRYSCTSEQKKALNIPLLQKNLYELGAFYVADIEAESTIDITNRGLLSEESDPRLNLKKWLEEKTFKNPDKIVELAEPIIAEAMKQSTTAEIHGVFKPVSISVRNYRNYKEENFDFSDISFCTINGVNGAGKSSLFMDAIVDCLFEETREALKQAFSQDGVPHQIIRNIIPHITDTTNNILGQMTGGTMGVEFVMERTVKGKDGDKATLDVLINEYGKTTLPYASKSGGEKVKASLAVILALSEIKATAAGIQLGMLFIDEPPFLDDEGAQAYVDALETIRDRYSDVKITKKVQADGHRTCSSGQMQTLIVCAVFSRNGAQRKM